jgi:hypothetical protein
MYTKIVKIPHPLGSGPEREGQKYQSNRIFLKYP